MECAVCLLDISNNNCCTIPCGHMFHTTCIVGCNNKCPLCRKVINNLLNNDSNPNPNPIMENHYEDIFEYSEDIIDTELSLEMKIRVMKQLAENCGAELIVDKFLKYLDEKNYEHAYKLKSIYNWGSNKYFRRMKLPIVVTNYDTVIMMDNLLDGTLSESKIKEIEDKVLNLMLFEFDNENDGVDRSYILNL
jgi:hypothetical protein